MRGGDGLFEVEPFEAKRRQGRPAAVDKTFRAFDPHQVPLLPPSLDDWPSEGHPARFVADLVDEVLDLGPVLADYTEKRGYPPYDPRLMLRLLIYGHTTGARSSRAIERKCVDDVAFRFPAADQARRPRRGKGLSAHRRTVHGSGFSAFCRAAPSGPTSASKVSRGAALPRDASHQMRVTGIEELAHHKCA